MKTIVLFSTVVFLGALFGRAGTITGTVRAEGKREAEQTASDGKYDSRKYKFAERVNYAELQDFVVYIDGDLGQKSAPPEKPLTVDTRRIAQKGATFSPHVLPVVAGTTVEWPNNDEIFHNVFSMSEVKPFDLDLYKGLPPDKHVTFDKTGRVDVFCSIHAKMHCVVLVLQNPYFAAVDPSGNYSITNVPAGTYKLKAWHERLPAQSREITVPEKGELKVDFVLGITNLPKY
ncbi:MAG: plastocyanin/azurin family copper-binding protein [Verrucomicrobiota bacterium]